MGLALLLVACGGSGGGNPSNGASAEAGSDGSSSTPDTSVDSGGAPSDAAADAPPSTPITGSDAGGGAYGAACDSQFTDGCSSIPGPGTSACGEDPTHCCETRRGCASGLTCVGATCSIGCSAAIDCGAITPTAACVFVFSDSTLKGCFEPCPDSGSCPGDLVCRPTTPVTTCEQYLM